MAVAAVSGAHKTWASVGAAPPGASASFDSTGGTCIVVGMSSYDGNGGSEGVTDNKGNTYTRALYRVTPSDEVLLWVCLNPTVGTGHIITGTIGSGAANYTCCTVSVFSGTDTSAALVASNSNGSGSGATVTTGSVTPGSGDLLVSVYSDAEGSSSTISIDNSFAITDQSTGNTAGRNGAMAWLAAPSTSAINPQWTGPSGTQGKDAAIVVIKAAGGGGPTFIAARGPYLNQSAKRASFF